jgi:hypothetical protein
MEVPQKNSYMIVQRIMAFAMKMVMIERVLRVL